MNSFCMTISPLRYFERIWKTVYLAFLSLLSFLYNCFLSRFTKECRKLIFRGWVIFKGIYTLPDKLRKPRAFQISRLSTSVHCRSAVVARKRRSSRCPWRPLKVADNLLSFYDHFLYAAADAWTTGWKLVTKFHDTNCVSLRCKNIKVSANWT